MEDVASAAVAASDLNVPEERKRALYAAVASGDVPSGAVTVRLGYRPPFRFGEVLAFFRDRALAGVEAVGESSYARAVRLPAPGVGAAAGWVRVEDDLGKNRLVVAMSDELDFGPGALAEEQVQRLLAIKGVGPWTANYVAMHMLSHPDAFLESDVGVAHALPDLSPKQRLALAEAWRPWRSYAVMMLWNSL